MSSLRLPSIFALLILLAAGACAPVFGAEGARKRAENAAAASEPTTRGSEWVSYRDAYMQMIRFEKYGKPKHLIQQHYQVSPRSRDASLEGVVLTLSGSSSNLSLALDAAGRAVFPFLKSAYDDNARLLLNRRAGLYELHPRISIIPRPDGIYDISDLRAACDQALNYLRYAGAPSFRDRQCVGVRFSYYPSVGEVNAGFAGANAAPVPLPVEPGSAFPDESSTIFKTVNLHFAEWPEKGRVILQSMPAVVAPLFK